MKGPLGVITQVNLILIAKEMTHVSSDLTLSNGLYWPKHGIKLVVAYICYFVGLTLIFSFLLLESLAFIHASKIVYVITFSAFCFSFIMLGKAII